MKQKIYLIYVWLLILIYPLILYYFTNTEKLSSSLAQYICSTIFIIAFSIYCFNNIKVKVSRKDFSLIGFSFLLLYIALEISAYYTFHINAYDFSIFMSLIEQALIGNWGYSKPIEIFHFGIHQNWILLSIILFFKVWNSSLVLLILSSILLWLPGLFIFIYLQKYLKLDSLIAFLGSIVYWINSYTIKLLTAHFLPEFFFISAFFSLLFARQIHSKIYPLIIATIFFASVKEDFIFYLVPWAIYNIGFLQDKRFYWVVLISIIIFFIDFEYIQPYFLNKSNISYPSYYNFWNEWGETPKQIMLNIILHPLKVLKHLFAAYGWKRLYGALLFIPFLSLDMLCFSIIPLILYSLAAKGTGLNSFGNYYSYLIWPISLIGFFQVFSIVSNSKFKYVLAIVLVLNPLWGTGGLYIYRPNKLIYTNFLDMKNKLSRNLEYCISEGLYPHFNSTQYNIFIVNRIKYHPNCQILLSKVGDLYPYNNRSMELVINKLNEVQCITDKFGEFYLTKNNSLCHNVILNNL